MVSSTVIIPAYTLDRWVLLCNAVASVEAQSSPPTELILCIDRNTELFKRSIEKWGSRASAANFPIKVIENRFEQDDSGDRAHERAHGLRRRFGAGWARNSGAERALGDVLVFLDDDAAAEADWLKYLLEPYESPLTVAVGGAPLPSYETHRPSWFPSNFDWVFGCAYRGMPTHLAPLGHLIGANMSVRREVFEQVGGFHSIDFDDLDLCMRVAAHCPDQKVLYEPRAIVHHFVPAQRVEWRYFWRRCYFVNREKVNAFAEMGEAANIRAERAFVRRALTEQVAMDISDVLRGRWSGLSRMGAMIVGVAAAAAGHVVGRLRLYSRRRRFPRSREDGDSTERFLREKERLH
jgi:cellulose synthase/poly-beta-1,6-N-acetylglucosamine synthase-like glycosyltransferase